MWYFVIVLVLIFVGFFMWSGMEDRKRKKKEHEKHEDEPLFHTEDDLEEYGKPMERHPVDFDDAE